MDAGTVDAIPDRRERRTRHIEVGVIIAVCTFGLALVTQTAVVAWGAGQISTKVDYILVRLEQFDRDRYTQSDARRDQAVIDARMTDIVRRVQHLEEQHDSLSGSGIFGKRP